MMTKMEKLLSLELKVFTVQDLMTIWGVFEKKKLWSLIRYYLRVGKLKKVYKGVYSIGEYDELGLAQKLLKPSYISYYTALAFHGVIFQFYGSVHCVGLISKKIKINDKEFVYHKLKESVFYNSLGIVSKKNFVIAGLERAVTDSLYLAPTLSFDELSKVSKQKLHEVSKIYNNKSLEKRVDLLIKTME
jgi:predicted transcriptional regulator of viral defense system